MAAQIGPVLGRVEVADPHYHQRFQADLYLPGSGDAKDANTG